jgi:hypothetical protein
MFKINEMSQACQWREIRNQRKPLLDDADRLVNKAQDTNGDVAAARNYRQALRDITTTFDGRLDELQWPIKP